MFVVDTSALIGAWERTHRPSVFPTLWAELGNHVDAGRIRAPKDVQAELEAKTGLVPGTIAAWCDQRTGMFAELTPEMIAHVRELVRRFPSLAMQRHADTSADPMVVAMAAQQGGVVVAEEIRRSGKPKIPLLCDHLSVRHVTSCELFEELGIRV